MKHKRKLGRKLLSFLLTLAMVFSTMTGIVPGMSMTVFAEETTIRCEGTAGSIDTMFPQNGIGRNSEDDNEDQLSANRGASYFIAPEGKCFTQIVVTESANNDGEGDDCWTGWQGRAINVNQTKYIIPSRNDKIIIDFTVDDLAIYNVILNTNGGTVNDGNISTYSEFYGATLPTNVTRNGYIFEGWYDNADLSGEPVTAIASDATGEKAFWAKWTKVPINLTDCTVTPIPDQTYTGSAIMPELTVTYGEVTLTKNTDYTVNYSNNTDVGKATCVLTGIDGNTGEISVSFNIVKSNSSLTVAPTANALTYNGKPQELVTAGEATGGTMRYALGTKDAATEEYTTFIPTATNAGTYYVWYKVAGDDEHIDSDAACVKVTIAEKKDDSDKKDDTDKKEDADTVAKPEYKNTSGAGASWSKDTTGTLDFTFKRTENDETTYDHNKGVMVDENVVDPTNYTKEKGSVIIKLKSTFLDTLAAGEHTLTAMFDDGDDVTVKFTVAAKAADVETKTTEAKTTETKKTDSPKTGDNSNIPLAFMLMLDSAMAAIYLTLRRREEK